MQFTTLNSILCIVLATKVCNSIFNVVISQTFHPSYDGASSSSEAKRKHHCVYVCLGTDDVGLNVWRVQHFSKQKTSFVPQDCVLINNMNYTVLSGSIL